MKGQRPLPKLMVNNGSALRGGEGVDKNTKTLQYSRMAPTNIAKKGDNTGSAVVHVGLQYLTPLAFELTCTRCTRKDLPKLLRLPVVSHVGLLLSQFRLTRQTLRTRQNRQAAQQQASRHRAPDSDMLAYVGREFSASSLTPERHVYGTQGSHLHKGQTVKSFHLRPDDI